MVGVSDIKVYKSSNNSLGGAITGIQVNNATPNGVFGNAGQDQLATGADHYNCVYIKNTHSSEDMENFNFWLGSDTLPPDTTVQWGFDSSNLGSTVFGYKWSPFFTATGSNFDDTPDSAALDLSTFTLAAWFKTSSSYAVNSGSIASKGGWGSDTAGQNNSYGIEIESTAKIHGQFETGAGVDYDVRTPTGGYNDGKWHFVMMTYDLTTLKLFVDDMTVPVDSVATTALPEVNAISFRIGSNPRAADHFFTGNIDEVRVWNRALTSQNERVALYQNNTVNQTGLVLEKTFGTNDFNLVAQTIPNYTTVPSGVLWIPANFEPSPVNVELLKHGKSFPIWIWWHIEAGCVSRKDDAATFNFSFYIPQGGTGSTGSGTGGGTGGGGGGTGGIPVPTPTDYKIAFVGDEGCETATDDVIDLIKTNKYDYVWSVGDHAYASSSCWTDRFTSLKPNFNSAYGNHEYSESGGTSPYKSFFTHDKTYFTKKVQNILFLVADTNIDCDPGGTQHSFIKSALEASHNDSTIKWRIAIMHHPWFGASSSHTYNDSQQVEAFHALFMQHKVDFVVTGHNHNWQRSHQVAFNKSNPKSPTAVDSTAPYASSTAGLIHIVTGTGGHDSGSSLYSLGSQPSWQAFQNKTHNGVWEIVASNSGNTLTCSFVEIGGDKFDTFQIGQSATAGEVGSSTVDAFGITMLYPTKTNARTWYNKWGNGIARSWNSKGMAIRSPDPEDPELDLHCPTGDSIGLMLAEIDGNGICQLSGSEPHLYVNDPNRLKQWENVEITVYYNMIDYTSATGAMIHCAIAGRSEHQDDYQCIASGHAYSFEINDDGTIKVRKELVHPSYADDVVSGTSGAPSDIWIGLKLVIQTVGSTVVVTGYRDLTDGANGGTWTQLVQKVDPTWAMTGTPDINRYNAANEGTGTCTKIATNTTTLFGPATSCSLRCANMIMQFKKFSIREIDAA